PTFATVRKTQLKKVEVSVSFWSSFGNHTCISLIGGQDRRLVALSSRRLFRRRKCTRKMHVGSLTTSRLRSVALLEILAQLLAKLQPRAGETGFNGIGSEAQDFRSFQDGMPINVAQDENHS